MAWSMASYHRLLRVSQKTKNNISWIGTFVQFMWHFMVTGEFQCNSILKSQSPNSKNKTVSSYHLYPQHCWCMLKNHLIYWWDYYKNLLNILILYYDRIDFFFQIEQVEIKTELSFFKIISIYKLLRSWFKFLYWIRLNFNQ